MICKENLEVEVYHHPDYQSINEELMSDLSKLTFYSHKDILNHTNIKGDQIGFIDSKPRGVYFLENWVYQIIESKLRDATNPIHYKFNTWAARLDRGQETVEHGHLYFATFAFVYFVNAPEGASPLVFPTSGVKIKAEPGKLVLFPGPLRHKVPVNDCDNRVTIASNVTLIEGPVPP